MSDNLRRCPKCIKTAEAAKLAEKAAIDAVYGTIPVSEFLERLSEYNKETDVEDTLHEDYEIGMNPEGDFYLDYSCYCDCGFAWGHKQSIPVI